jgi:uncharacterized protein (DUF849 family)
VIIKACLNGARAPSGHRALPLTPRQLAADGASAGAAGAQALHIHPRGEDGHVEVMAALAAAGVGIEAGLWQIDDVAALQAGGFADALTRVLVEPGEEDAAAAATDQALDDALVSAVLAL